MTKYLSIIILFVTLFSFGQNPNRGSKEIKFSRNIIKESYGTTSNTFISESGFQRGPRSFNFAFEYRFNQKK